MHGIAIQLINNVTNIEKIFKHGSSPIPTPLLKRMQTAKASKDCVESVWNISWLAHCQFQQNLLPFQIAIANHKLLILFAIDHYILHRWGGHQRDLIDTEWFDSDTERQQKWCEYWKERHEATIYEEADMINVKQLFKTEDILQSALAADPLYAATQ